MPCWAAAIRESTFATMDAAKSAVDGRASYEVRTF